MSRSTWWSRFPLEHFILLNVLGALELLVFPLLGVLHSGFVSVLFTLNSVKPGGWDFGLWCWCRFAGSCATAWVIPVVWLQMTWEICNLANLFFVFCYCFCFLYLKALGAICGFRFLGWRGGIGLAGRQCCAYKHKHVVEVSRIWLQPEITERVSLLLQVVQDLRPEAKSLMANFRNWFHSKLRTPTCGLYNLNDALDEMVEGWRLWHVIASC